MNPKDFYKYIAVILVYRNETDLRECIDSFHQCVSSCRVIVVNAFHDQESMQRIQDVAREKDCDFINVENKGYGHGNNRGIEHAVNTYDFEYAVISNPDVVIKEFPKDEFDFDVIAPMIRNVNGKAQNPMIIKKSRIYQRLIFMGMKKQKRLYLLMGITMNKLKRECGMRIRNVIGKKSYPIYQPHGSFVMIHKRVIEKLHPIFDENMFLFAEENVIAMKLEDNGFLTYYVPTVKVLHKEDGSMKLSDRSIDAEHRRSNLYFYETYGIR